MNASPSQSGVPSRPPKAGRILGEALLVATLGAVFAFAANRISPRGLALKRDYFPTGVAHQVRPVASVAHLPVADTNPTPASAAAFLAEQMRQKGLQLIDGRQALQYFRDPRFRQDKVVFIDARKEDEYQKGHIPGAYEFDSYYASNYVATVLPVCFQADQIVVYCNGGICDDSESAALWLRDDAGISNQKLFVYGGGFKEWTTNSLPVETGSRNSGILLKTSAASGINTLPKTNP